MEITNLIIQSLKNALTQDVAIVALIFCIFLVLISFLIKFSKKKSFLKYRTVDALFSNAEHSFFLVLKQAFSDEYEILAKVRIADVLLPVKGLTPKNRSAAFYKITSKHFDYVLCDKQTLAVKAVIELDDKSHNQKKVKNRDAFVEKACESAGLKLIRFQCKVNYQIQAIRNSVFNAIH
ncbi:MAG: DUF2726 domain-containing protein [Nitrosomonas sp.]|nr:DUF2726 domain-containing protein [Nitrosomonas sp.]